MKTITITLTDEQYADLVETAEGDDMTPEARATWLVTGWNARHPDGRRVFPEASYEKWKAANC